MCEREAAICIQDGRKTLKDGVHTGGKDEKQQGVWVGINGQAKRGTFNKGTQREAA